MHSLIVAIETQRHQSVGTFLRCAAAFGADEFIVVGSPIYGTHGAHGAQRHMKVKHFYYWSDCIAYCRAISCLVFSISPQALIDSKLGPEMSDTNNSSYSSRGNVLSENVDNITFTGSVCFIIGDKNGLTEEMCSISDKVLHVEMPIPSFENMVVYDAKVAIVLQHFASSESIHFAPRAHEGEKHVLGSVDVHQVRTVRAGRELTRLAGDTVGSPYPHHGKAQQQVVQHEDSPLVGLYEEGLNCVSGLFLCGEESEPDIQIGSGEDASGDCFS